MGNTYVPSRECITGSVGYQVSRVIVTYFTGTRCVGMRYTACGGGGCV